MAKNKTVIVEVLGNRLTDIVDTTVVPPVVIGYRMHTGPKDTETDPNSFCGDARVLEFYHAELTNLTKYPQGVCTHQRTWNAYSVTYEETDGTGDEELLCYPAQLGQPMGSVQPEKAVGAKAVPDQE